MKKTIISNRNANQAETPKPPEKIIFLTVLIILMLTGCASLFYSVSIRTSGNISSILAGGTLQLSASGREIVWRVSSRSDGSGSAANGTFISANGLLTADRNETASVLYVTATSTKDGFSDIRQIRVVTVTAVNVSSSAQAAVAGRTTQFQAQVMGSNNPDNLVTWTVGSNSTGSGSVTQGTSINSSGVLTVAANETLSTLYIRATSVIDPTKSGIATISVVVPTVTSVTIAPANQSVRAGSTQQFRATVTGTYEPSQAVTWRVSSNALGTGAVTPGTSINSNGVLTVAANETLTTLYIVATSTFDTTKSGSTSVSIVIPAVTNITIAPVNPSIQAGSSIQFAATVVGVNNPSTDVTWKVSSNAAGTGTVTQGTSINANGLLTVAANETMNILFVFATSVFDPSKFSSVFVHVTAAPATLPAPVPQPTTPTVTSVTVTPANQSVQAGGSFQFSATVTGTNNPGTAVTWRVSSNAAGTGAVTAGTSISASGLLTVSANETINILYVIATSAVDTTKAGSVSVNVTAPIVVIPPSPATPTVTSVTVTPANQSVQAGGSFQFSATVTGTNNPGTAVTWRVSSNAAGTGAVTAGTSISASGLLTVSANETINILYVIATSAVDTTKSGSVAVSVTVPVVIQPPSAVVPSVTITPATVSARTNTQVQFNAAVTGVSNTSIIWNVSPNPSNTGTMAPSTAINANGLLTIAPNEWAPTLYVFAFSAADHTLYSMAVVTVTNNNANQGPNQGGG